jgi:CDP-glucose 4,6-dehydratase
MESLEMSLFADTYRGKRVVVTGHTGFKGSWLCLWLSRLGAQVVGLSLPAPTEPNNFAAARIRETLAGHEQGDIRDFRFVRQVLDHAEPQIIFHLAAQAIVRESYESPLETLETNAVGTAHVLEAVRQRGTPCVVIVVTSDKCYENRAHIWGYREEDRMGGHDIYSASKGMAELVTSSYRRSFFDPSQISKHGIKVASTRAGNVIGGGDWAKDRIVADAVTHLARGESVPVRNPSAIRPWQHVLEPLGGYLSLGARLLTSDDPHLCSGWNFGPQVGDEATVGQLVTQLCDTWGGGRWEAVNNQSEPHEAGILRLSIDKATWLLNWRPTWSLEKTVSRTAQWYRRFYEHPSESMREACIDDLEAYLIDQNRERAMHVPR